MAEIDIQQKQGASPWLWILGAVLLIGIVWWVWAANTNRGTVAEAPATGITAPGEMSASSSTLAEGAEAATPELPLAAIQANPDNYFGKPISGLATITEVVGDQGFRIEQDGQQMFVVKDASLANTTLTAGNKVSFTGTVMDPQHMEQVPEVMQLPETVQRDLQNAPAFIKATNIEMQNA